MPEESLANSRWQRVNKLRMILGTKNLSGLCKFYSNYIIWLKYKRVCSQGEILKEALTRSLFGSRILWLSVFAWSINPLKWWLVGNLFGRYKRLIGNIVTQNLVGKNYACLLKNVPLVFEGRALVPWASEEFSLLMSELMKNMET